MLNRYLPLVDRVASRQEFADLVWELQGELGTSHSYELGGDYRPGPHYHLGLLGADLAYDAAAGGWKVQHILRGDPWDEKAGSPFERPAVVDGQHFDKKVIMVLPIAEDLARKGAARMARMVFD